MRNAGEYVTVIGIKRKKGSKRREIKRKKRRRRILELAADR